MVLVHDHWWVDARVDSLPCGDGSSCRAHEEEMQAAAVGCSLPDCFDYPSGDPSEGFQLIRMVESHDVWLANP